MATRVGRGKIQLAAFAGHFRKLPHKCKKFCRYILHKPSYSQFCPEFRCRGKGGENAIGSIRWHIPETPYRRKNLLRKPILPHDDIWYIQAFDIVINSIKLVLVAADHSRCWLSRIFGIWETIVHHPVLWGWSNKKFELMLTRRAKAYSSSGSVV